MIAITGVAGAGVVVLVAAAVARHLPGAHSRRVFDPSPPPLRFGGPAVRLWSPLQRALDRRSITAGLAELVETLARFVRAGSSVRGALVASATATEGPLGADLGWMAQRLDNGATLPEVLDGWRRYRHDLPDVGLLTVALTIAAGSGGSVARALDGVADTIRGEQHLRAEVRALASQAEASALLVAVLPLAFGVIAGVADPRTIAFLTTEPVGIACLATGLSLDIGAWWWMRRITAGIEW